MTVITIAAAIAAVAGAFAIGRRTARKPVPTN